jgi:hypothetical protein
MRLAALPAAGHRSNTNLPASDHIVQLALNKRQRSGTPLSSCSPAGSKVKPLPATRSLTVCETSTYEGCASAEMRAPVVVTAIPACLPSITSHSPVWMPARVSMPRSRTRSRIWWAQWMARAGPHEDQRLSSRGSAAPRFGSTGRSLAGRAGSIAPSEPATQTNNDRAGFPTRRRCCPRSQTATRCRQAPRPPPDTRYTRHQASSHTEGRERPQTPSLRRVAPTRPSRSAV